jgi:hypothetical protein
MSLWAEPRWADIVKQYKTEERKGGENISYKEGGSGHCKDITVIVRKDID